MFQKYFGFIFSLFALPFTFIIGALIGKKVDKVYEKKCSQK